MSARVKLILVGVAALLVCVIFYFFFVKPRSAELDKTTNEIAAAQAETAGLQAQLNSLEELRDDQSRLRADLAEFRELVPPTHDTANFMFMVNEAAGAAGVPFIQIDPEDPKNAVEGVTLAQLRVTIAAQGGYFSIQDFIRRMSELDRAVGIDSLQMTAVEGEDAEEKGRIALSLVIRIFFEVPEVQAPTTAPGEVPVTTETPAPGATETPAAPDSGAAPDGSGTPAEQAG